MIPLSERLINTAALQIGPRPGDVGVDFAGWPRYPLAQQRQKSFYRILILEPIDDELLLFHPGQTKIIYCNATASLVWQLCDGQRTVQEIIELLQTAYPEARNKIVTDVQATLRQFAQQGALELG